MKFDSLDSNFAYARFHQVPSNRILTKLALRFHSCSLSVHCEFSRIVCVSLFSYQGSLLAVSQTARLLYHIHQCLSSTFFKFFRSFFDVCASLSGDLFTLSHPHRIVNNFFCFFQNISNCLFRRNNSS